MATIKHLTYSMPRGDSRTLPIALPVDTYAAGASLFFAIKEEVDNVLDDSSAVLLKELTDADITSTDDTDVHYLLVLEPADTNTIDPAQYRAELEYVSADQSVVITFPDPAKAVWDFTITGDINRRIS